MSKRHDIDHLLGACAPAPHSIGCSSAQSWVGGPGRALLRVSIVAGHIGKRLEPRLVSIGDVKHKTKAPTEIALVPQHYAKAFADSRLALEIWQWLLRKDSIGQDCFLIGPPGPLRRRLALAWCEVLSREVEYLALSRDTTEADLKQRREITSGTLEWIDQPPVRAARHGRVLILDGLEKAERNVLPTLNNLLENREMSLQDGSFLTSPERFDALTDAGAAKAARLVRVHEEFRVIALGLPVPLFPGFPLDPPLRSRFQARHVGASPIGVQLAALKAKFPNLKANDVEALASFADAMGQLSKETAQVPGPKPWPLSEEILATVCEWMDMYPMEQPSRLLHRMYPFRFLPHDAAKACKEALIGAGLAGGHDDPQTAYHLRKVERLPGKMLMAEVTIAAGSTEVSLTVPSGRDLPSLAPMRTLLDTPSQSALLSEAMQCAAAGKDVCFVGASGEGKTVLARRFATALGYPVTDIFTFHLYKDMTSRDFLLRRSTDDRGDTFWEPSPLLTAALSGGVCILDGLQRLRPDTIAALQALTSDRDLNLADGTRLCSQDRYAQVCAAAGHGDRLPEHLSLGDGRQLRPMHNAFRLVALATPPGQRPTEQWLSAEVLPLFAWIPVLPLGPEERSAVLAVCAPSPALPQLLSLAERLQAASDKSPGAEKSWALSLRQLIRLARRTAHHPQSLADDVRRIALSSFMPVAARQAFEALLHEELGATARTDLLEQGGIAAKVQDGVLDIGGSQLPVARYTDPRLVPKTKFFDIPRHLLRLREMMRDLVIGERHLLLIGNQGTGKNKLVDNLLQLLRWEREYIQLHRDTTVSALTVQASLLDGKVVWEDSPLVQAVRYGRTLVVDEADKAPLEVVCVLKGLVEDGEMSLSDGRRILRDAHGSSDRIIQVHPNFKMILLANRPGFPFQGNDLFRETGDVYAPHLIENPDLDSEVSLLASYAPDVDVTALRRLSSAFTELRQQVDDGLLAYPYSTRELVNIARHLQMYPGQSVGQALRDILDFDRHDRQTVGALREVLLRWGIPLDASAEGASTSNLATDRRLPEPIVAERWLLKRCHKIPTVTPFQVESRDCSYMLAFTRGMKIVEAQGSRTAQFSEEVFRWCLPLGVHRYETESCVQGVILPDTGLLCVLTERDTTGAFSIIMQDIHADVMPKTCDRLEAPFGIRSPMRKDSDVKLFPAGSNSFGLAGERRVYIVTISEAAQQATELTLPLELLASLAGLSGTFAPSTSPFIDRLPAAPRWNVDFASEGVLVLWVPGNEAVAVLSIDDQSCRCYTIPGLKLSAVWMLTSRELLLQGAIGMIHLDVSLRGQDALLSEVKVVHSPGSEGLNLKRVQGANKALLPREACATVSTRSAYLGTLTREVRGSFAHSPQVEHFGMDAFAACVWPRGAVTVAEPLWVIPPSASGTQVVSAVLPEGHSPEAWHLELFDVGKGTMRRWEPPRLSLTEDMSEVLDETPKQEGRLAAIGMLSSRVVLVQTNGWVRVVEVNPELLQEQLKQWQSMMGAATEQEPLSLKLNGEEVSLEDEEEEPVEDSTENDEDEDGNADSNDRATQLAVVELNKAFTAIEEATRSQSLAQASLEEMRAQMSATTVAASGREALAKVIAGTDATALNSDVRELLERAATDPAGLAREAEASRLKDVEQDSGPSTATASSRAAIANALASAFSSKETLEERMVQLAEAAAKLAEQEVAKQFASGAAGGGAANEAQLEAARAILRASAQLQGSMGAGQAEPGAMSLAGSMAVAADQFQSLVNANSDLASALQGGETGGAAQSKVEQSRGQVGNAASSLLGAVRSLAKSASQAVRGRGRRHGSGRGRGQGRGSGGSGSGSGSGSRRGGRSGKGFGQGPQLSSNQKGGYTDAQLKGELSDEDNQAAARVMNKSRALAKREATNRSLRDFSSEQYDTALKAVSRQIRELRVVLEQQEAKDREREWVGHQATGELDDARLVDGVTGEKMIYRKRIEPDVPAGSPIRLPKRLSFVMDVSASMSRFNGEDGRLDRMVQAIVMLMESLEGFEHKYVWNLVGHSGNGAEIPFVDFGNPPQTRQHRAQVISAIASASAIAASGDSTTEAIDAAVKQVASREADDYLVFAVSDANLGGYGITPEVLRRVLTANPKVTASAIFIAEREAAQMLSTALPPGRGFVCLDVSQLPTILKEIFARAATSS